MGKFKFQDLIKSHNIICALIINLTIGSATAETYVLGTLSNEVPPEYVLKINIKDGERIQASASETLNSDLSLNSTEKFKYPVPFVAMHVGTDNTKRWAIIGIDAEQRIWMGDGKQWTHTEPGIVSKQNDYKDALSIFPRL